jgi:type VI secretion system protein ImpL
MLPILRAIQPYLPLTGLVLAIFGVTIIVLLILHLRKAAKPAPSAAAPPPPPPPEPPSEPRKPLIAEREPSLALEDEPVRKASRSMTLGRVLNILRDRRYKVPWYALVGAPAAGKTALVSTLDLAPDRLDGGPSAVGEPGWWLFDDGVIVDVPGSLFLSDNGANKDHMWRLFLQRIRRVRARRTLNGIILTISCDDLIGISALDREGLLERGRDLHTRLRSAQQITGLRLPIYVVVSKCDKVSGFTSYWASMPGRRHSEMFGWSNPNSLDSAYRSEWISQAFASLSTDLFRGQVAATQDVPVGDLRAPGMVLFPVAFGGLEQPLQAILSMIFQSTAYHESFFLRGMWFTGALPPVRELMAASLAQRTIGDGVDAVPTLSSLPHIPPRPVLMRQLLRQKIFPERAVALPLSQSWRTDSQTVRRAKIAAAVGGVVLCGGLSWSTYELEQDLGSLQQALSVVGADMKRDSGPSDPLPMAHLGADEIENVSHSSVSGPATQVLQQAINGQLRLNAARALLDALSTIRTNNLTVPFIPSSWFSSIDDDIAGFLSRGFEHVVLDAMEQQLALRTHKLLTDPLPQPGAGTTDLSAGRPASANALIAYLAALDILDKDVQRFNNLGTPEGAGELPDLVRSLIGIDLPPEFNNYPDLLQSAMQRGGHHRFSIDRYHGVASERTSQLMWMVLNDLTVDVDTALELMRDDLPLEEP